MRSNIVLTLVHGTFAADADWIEATSDFARGLKLELGDEVIFKKFRWSGSNNHLARKVAGTELATQLAKQFDDYPDCQHFVVAHSHGGNVALHAQQKEEIAKNLAGIITLGTPFLRCIPRNSSFLTQTLATILMVLDGLLRVLLGVAIFLVGIYLGNKNPQSWAFQVYSSVVLLPFMVWLFINAMRHHPLSVGWRMVRGTNKEYSSRTSFTRNRIEYYKSLISPRADRSQINSCDKVNYITTNCPPLFALTVSDDEADIWLRLTRRIVEMPLMFTKRIEKVLPNWIKASLFSGAGALAFFGKFEHTLKEEKIYGAGFISYVAYFLMFVFVVATVVTLALLIIYIILLLMSTVFHLVLRASAIGFGGETPLDIILCNIYISKSPADIDCETREIPASEVGLNHSSLWQTPLAIAAVSRWIKRHLVA